MKIEENIEVIKSFDIVAGNTSSKQSIINLFASELNKVDDAFSVSWDIDQLKMMPCKSGVILSHF